MAPPLTPWLRLLAALGQRLRFLAVARRKPVSHEISDWVHIGAIQVLVFHATAVVTTLILTALTGLVIRRVMHEGPIKQLVILIDQAAAALLILFFVAELLLHLWPR